MTQSIFIDFVMFLRIFADYANVVFIMHKKGGKGGLNLTIT